LWQVRTKPSDLAEDLLRDSLRDGWNFLAASLSYQAVGFGSHHWLATNAAGDRLFVTVDDLSAKLRSAADTTDAAFGRLELAFTTALSLNRDAGLGFVVAPIPADDGRLLHRLRDRYSLVAHPYLDCQPGHDGDFETGEERLAVLDLLIALHGASADVPRTDDFEIPMVAELMAAMDQTGEPWQSGPYGARARDLLAVHAADLALLLAAYAELVVRVAARPERVVMTHGEPSASNVLNTPGGLVVVDWDSALPAAPERDLWELAQQDPSLLDAYSASTGVTIDHDALVLYRMWYDLAEISGYIDFFRQAHADTADAAESWQNLRHFLRPADRWTKQPDMSA
jgi:hypothetical protein